jgi:hypothetical protein
LSIAPSWQARSTQIFDAVAGSPVGVDLVQSVRGSSRCAGGVQPSDWLRIGLLQNRDVALQLRSSSVHLAIDVGLDVTDSALAHPLASLARDAGQALWASTASARRR